MRLRRDGAGVATRVNSRVRWHPSHWSRRMEALGWWDEQNDRLAAGIAEFRELLEQHRQIRRGPS